MRREWFGAAFNENLNYYQKNTWTKKQTLKTDDNKTGYLKKAITLSLQYYALKRNSVHSLRYTAYKKKKGKDTKTPRSIDYFIS